MILVLSKITEMIINKENGERGPQFVYEFGLDPKLSMNKEYSAVVLQVIVKEKLENYEVGEYYTFTSVPFITSGK